jgi:hypothetical protein
MQPGAVDPNFRKSPLTRTDFIVLFIWKEPTPADGLLKPVEVADPSLAPGGFPAEGM